MNEKNGRTRRGRIPFAEKLEELNAQIVAARGRVNDLEERKRELIAQHQARAQAMLAELPKQQ